MAIYRADHTEFAKQMNTHEVRGLVKDRAEQGAVKLRAWAIAHAHTGNYARNVSVVVGKDLRVGDRPAAFLIANTAYATALEVGSHNIRNPPMPMTKLLDEIGD